MSIAQYVGFLPIVIAFAAVADARAAGWAPRPGIEASGSYGTVSRTFEDTGADVLDAAYGAGWSVGATAEWSIARALRLVSGLRYIEAGESETIGITASGMGGAFTIRGDLHETWRWLAVPLRARVTLGALPLSFEAGPEVQLLLVAKSRQKLEDGAFATRAPGSAPLRAPGIYAAPGSNIFEDVGTFGGNGDVTDLYHRVNCVIGGGVSFAWPLGSGHISAHARGGLGLNDLMKSDFIERRTRTLEIGAGWHW